jgi:hypothetical protein
LSFDLGSAQGPKGIGFVAVSLPVKVEDRADENGPVIAQLCFPEGEPLAGRAIEKRLSDSWLVFRIPSDLCPEGGSLTFCALVDEVVLFQSMYRFVWRGRYPRLEAV